MPSKRIETPLVANKTSPKHLHFKKSYALRSSSVLEPQTSVKRISKVKSARKTKLNESEVENKQRSMLIVDYLLKRKRELESEMAIINKLLLDAQLKEDGENLMEDSELLEEYLEYEGLSLDGDESDEVDEEDENEPEKEEEQPKSVKVTRKLTTSTPYLPAGEKFNSTRTFMRSRSKKAPETIELKQTRQSMRVTRSGLRY